MEPVLKTGKFRPEIWSAASSNNASEAGRGLSPFSHFCLVVPRRERPLLAGKLEATSWQFTSMAEDLNLGQPRTNPASGQSRSQTQELLVANPMH